MPVLPSLPAALAASILLGCAGPAGDAPGATAGDTPGHVSIVPVCGTAGGAGPASRPYAAAVCADPALERQARRIDALAAALAAGLPSDRRPALEDQQRRFPETAYGCPEPPGAAGCVAGLLAQRERDLRDLRNSLDGTLPACRPADLRLRETGLGDYGMSHAVAAYRLDYLGGQACVLQGPPVVAIRDAAGARRDGYVEYEAAQPLPAPAGLPLPVVLSAGNPSAWFALSSSSGCDAPAGRPGYEVEISVPPAGTALGTIRLEHATCPRIGVSPLAAMSMLRAAVH